MIYIFDIDGTLADTDEKKYMRAEPDEAMIALINMLYDEGNEIKIVTSRGTGSGIDYREGTEKQLKNWGLRYDELIFGRIVSDKVTSPEEFLNES